MDRNKYAYDSGLEDQKKDGWPDPGPYSRDSENRAYWAGFFQGMRNRYGINAENKIWELMRDWKAQNGDQGKSITLKGKILWDKDGNIRH